MRSTCVTLLFLVVAGCGRGPSEAPDGGVVALDDHHTLAAPVTVGSLTVWPVLTDRPLDLGEFLTLDEALAKGAAEVREVGGDEDNGMVGGPVQCHEAPAQTNDNGGLRFTIEESAQTEQAGQTGQIGQAGQEAQQEQTLTQSLESVGALVNTLVIENKGDLPILVCAGTVVKGGNQDRQIGQDFVLKANSATPVDAFCVEPGRWTSDRLGRETGGKFQVLEGMATAKIRAKGQYEKDQQGVWDEVGNARMTFNTSVAAEPPPVSFANASDPGVALAFQLVGQSTSYAAAVDANAAASAEGLKSCEDAVKKLFADHKDAVGFAYAVNGKPIAVRTFAHPRLLRKQLDDFVRGMATEALLAKAETPAKPASASDVVALVAKISAADEKVADTHGLNRNGVRTNEVGYSGTCYVADKEGKLAPLTQDWTAR